jgi:TRAP-type C4-dicarboxylate transport system substrate-binding protein
MDPPSSMPHPLTVRPFRTRLLRIPFAIWAIAVLAAALALPAPATSQEAGQATAPIKGQVTNSLSWLMITEYPKNNISGIGLATFSRLVAAYTDGRITATIAYDNELKITSAQMPRAAQELRIAGGDAFAGALAAADPVFGLPSLPFVVQSVDVARAVNARARPLYEKALQARGLKLLYLTVWPSTGIWSDYPLATSDDLRRLVIRTYDASSTEVMRAAGGSAESLPLNDAVAALKEHRLNAFLTSGDGGAGRKLWDYLHHFTPVNYAMPVSLAFVRSEAFDALPDELRKQILAAAADTERSQFNLLANRTTENYAHMRANGVAIAEPAPAAVVAALRQAAARPLAAWKAKVNDEAVAIVDWALRQ